MEDVYLDFIEGRVLNVCEETSGLGPLYYYSKKIPDSIKLPVNDAIRESMEGLSNFRQHGGTINYLAATDAMKFFRRLLTTKFNKKHYFVEPYFSTTIQTLQERKYLNDDDVQMLTENFVHRREDSEIDFEILRGKSNYLECINRMEYYLDKNRDAIISKLYDAARFLVAAQKKLADARQDNPALPKCIMDYISPENNFLAEATSRYNGLHLILDNSQLTDYLISSNKLVKISLDEPGSLDKMQWTNLCKLISGLTSLQTLELNCYPGCDYDDRMRDNHLEPLADAIAASTIERVQMVDNRFSLEPTKKFLVRANENKNLKFISLAGSIRLDSASIAHELSLHYELYRCIC